MSDVVTVKTECHAEVDEVVVRKHSVDVAEVVIKHEACAVTVALAKTTDEIWNQVSNTWGAI